MLKIRRRRFLQSAGATTVASLVRPAEGATRKVPLAFSTMCCPKWGWGTILDQAVNFGYSGVELRGIQGEMDLTRRPEFSPARLRQSLREAEARDVRLLNLCASARLHEPEAAKRAKHLDEARRFIDLAERLETPYVRVFPDSYVKGEEKRVTVERIITNLRELGLHARGSRVTVLLETHGDFADAETLLKIMKGAEMPSVGVLWDTEHTFAKGKEQPPDTFRTLRRYVRLAQLRDSVPAGNGVRYVLTGSGTVPVREIVQVLAEGGYQGYYSFDWPKLWQSELAEPEVALPHFARFMRQLLTNRARTPK